MAAAKLRVGVIGTSWWADLEHLPGLRARGDVEVTGLCGRNPETLAALAAKWQVPETYTDWRALVARGRLDVLFVSTPNVLHHEQALSGLEAGCHVVCEKPLAMNAAEAREMRDRARALGRQTLTFFTHRAIAASALVKRLVDAGHLGRPVHVAASYLSSSHLRPGKGAEWRMQRALSGTGVLGDIGSHIVDLVRWWLGDLTRVNGQWKTVTTERDGVSTNADEQVSFLAQLACGAQATFHASKLAAGRGNFQRVELHGTGGSLVWEAEPGFDPTWEGRLWAGKPGATRLEPVPIPEDLKRGLDGPDPQANRDEAFRRLTDPFFDAIRRGGACEPDFADGAAVQAVLDAVAASAEGGAWVEVG